MATNATQEAWLKSAPGRAINPDNAYGLQCVDVADDYADAIFPGVGWQTSIGGVGGAREFARRSNAYVKWVPNVVGDLTSIPQRGDIIVWDGDSLNQWGHVAVVLSADANFVTVVQQDGFLQTVAHVAKLRYDQPGTGPCLGWLRPLVKLDNAVQSNQRVVGTAGVNERKTPSTKGAKARVFKSGDVLTFKGYVKNAEGVWFVGSFSGTYFHSSGFTNGAVGSLKNLTPVAAPALAATQRRVGKDGAALRKSPDKNGELVQTFKAGDVLNFVGYVIGTRPYGAASSDVWFKGTSGHYVWAGAVENGVVGKLTNLTPKTSTPVVAKPVPVPATVPAPAPAVPAYSFTKRWKTTTEVSPANIVNLQKGNFPPRPEYVVIHQIDDPPKGTYEGALGWFKTPRPEAPSSAHLVASGARLAECVDTVDRAFHAGAVGNNYIGVEVPPNPSAETIETVKRWLREHRDTMGYQLKLTRHKDVAGNQTSCGTHIDLALFDISAEAPDVPTKTEPNDTAQLTREQEATVLSNFFSWLTKLFINRKDS